MSRRDDDGLAVDNGRGLVDVLADVATGLVYRVAGIRQPWRTTGYVAEEIPTALAHRVSRATVPGSPWDVPRVPSSRLPYGAVAAGAGVSLTREPYAAPMPPSAAPTGVTTEGGMHAGT